MLEEGKRGPRRDSSIGIALLHNIWSSIHSNLRRGDLGLVAIARVLLDMREYSAAMYVAVSPTMDQATFICSFSPRELGQ